MRMRRSSLLHLAEQQVLRAERLPHRLHVGRLEAEGQVRGVADHPQVRQPLGRRQPGDGRRPTHLWPRDRGPATPVSLWNGTTTILGGAARRSAEQRRTADDRDDQDERSRGDRSQPRDAAAVDAGAIAAVRRGPRRPPGAAAASTPSTGGDEPVAARRHRLDEPRRRGVVAQRRPQLRDAEVQAALEVDVGVVPPERLPDLFARDDLARPRRSAARAAATAGAAGGRAGRRATARRSPASNSNGPKRRSSPSDAVRWPRRGARCRAAACPRRSGPTRARRTGRTRRARRSACARKPDSTRPEQLREEDHRHHRARDAADQRVRRLALHQRLRRHDDAGEREAEREARRASPSATHGSAPSSSAPRPMPARPASTSVAVRDTCPTDAPDHRHAEHHPDADHRADDAEHAGLRVQPVAHVDRDQRSEAADHEHARPPSPSRRTRSPRGGR